MCVEDESLLFQTDLLVPFSKGTWSEIFSITFPTRKMRCPMGQTKCITEKFMIPSHTPKHPFQPLKGKCPFIEKNTEFPKACHLGPLWDACHMPKFQKTSANVSKLSLCHKTWGSMPDANGSAKLGGYWPSSPRKRQADCHCWHNPRHPHE